MDWYGKAVEHPKMLSMGVAKNKAEIAGIEGVSRARGTQILNLINFAPEGFFISAGLILFGRGIIFDGRDNLNHALKGTLK